MLGMKLASVIAITLLEAGPPLMSVDVNSPYQANAPQNLLPPTVEAKKVADVASEEKNKLQAFEDEDGPSFADFLDIINPLQNLPIIGSIYRYLTGDERGAIPAVIGGALFGGPIGMAFAALEAAGKGESGEDIGGSVMAALFDDDKKGKTGDVMLAQDTKLHAPIEETAPAAAKPAEIQTASNGMVQDGEYLIFGRAGSPISALKPNRETGPLAQAVDASGPAQRGDFLVFGSIGADDQAAKVQQLQDATKAIKTDAATSALSGITQAAFAPAEDDQDASSGQITTMPGLQATTVRPPQDGAYRGMPVPARTGPEKPSQVLPPPTTGAGAIPGGQSEVRMGSVNKPVYTPPATAAAAIDNAETAKWFSSAFNKAMDKYERAQAINNSVSATDAAAIAPIAKPANSADAEFH